ncbi:MAG: hypothetical protein KGQ67_11645 [Betaproteobacteria bacterium]|nr:hypothetical protein [Betaproteobacteria bacterium]
MNAGLPPRTAGSAQVALDAVASALDAQQAAIAQGDAAGIETASAELSRALAALAGLGALRDPAARTRLARLRRHLAANAELLARARGINQRGVTALFGPSTTYGAGGSAAVATPSRSLRLA